VSSQSWEKLGLVYAAAGEQPWARTHAFLPTPLLLDEERIRVYVAFLDAGRVGRVGWVEVASRDPTRVLRVSRRPALDVGADGTFDDNGVTPVWIVRDGDSLLLFYAGWQLGTKVRYTLFTGVARSTDGGETFVRCSQVPVLDRSDGELYVRAAPAVLRDGGRWRMWYVGGDRWIRVRGKDLPSYSLRHLESADPLRWGRHGRVCLDLGGEDEFGVGRPWILKEDGRYRMWYSVRSISRRYHLGYAESPDGLEWKRLDGDLGIAASPEGWDSEMVCYSAVQATRYGTYLFYNGNNYGETGFGVASLLSPGRRPG
jgi:hypothetical protein